MGIRHINSGNTATVVQLATNVVRLPAARDECQVTAALADLSARVRSGEIVSLSVVMTTRDGVVIHKKLCSPNHACRDN